MHCKVSPTHVERMTIELTAAVEAMVVRLVEVVQSGEPTLEGLERAVLSELHSLGTVTLTALCATLVPRYPAVQAPCGCGGTAHYQRQRTAQCKTLLGVIHLRRPYYLCPTCHQGHCPLDRRLGLCAGSISAGLEALLALLGTEFSYGHAAEMVEQLSLVPISASRCRMATMAVGECLAQQEEQVRDLVWEQGHEPPPACPKQVAQPPLDPLYVSADGVMVLTRETGWREQCVGAVYTAVPSPSRPGQTARPVRSQSLSYVSELGAHAPFSDLLWLEAQRRGLEQAQRIVFIGDGAPWLWQTAAELFPTAVQILDWYHATSYVWQVAHGLHPTDAPMRTQWAEAQLDALWHSRTVEVIARLAPLAAGCKAAHEALTYFTTNQTRMDYARYRHLGLQVGSGTIESACKHVIQARLKQAGMRWCVRNARSMGKLRARLKSGRWQETLALRPPPRRSSHRRLSP